MLGAYAVVAQATPAGGKLGGRRLSADQLSRRSCAVVGDRRWITKTGIRSDSGPSGVCMVAMFVSEHIQAFVNGGMAVCKTE